MQEEKPIIEIHNRKASYEYFLTEVFQAGIMLLGSEIKSIRNGKANLKDAYCLFHHGELYVKSMFIAEYKFANHDNYNTRRDRKLLLQKHELRKINRKLREKGFTLVPTRLFVTERGLAKLDVALAEGKRSYDKRASIKEKDQKREMDRGRKYR